MNKYERDTQRAYWNQVADHKEFTTPFQIAEFSALTPRSAFILDVGCGYGRTLAELHGHGYAYLEGVDFSEKLIERAWRECASMPGITFSVQESEGLNFPDASKDAILLFAVLTCITDDERQRRLMAEIHRVLKPGGILYVNDFLLNDDERNLTRYAEYQLHHSGPYGCFTLPEGATLRHHDPAHMQELLAAWETVRLENTVFRTMNDHTSRGFFFFGRKG